VFEVGILDKLRLKSKPKEEEHNYLIEISYGRGRKISLGMIKSTESQLYDKVIEAIQERPDANRIKYYYITFPDGHQERYENPLYMEGEEDEEGEEVTERRRKGKSKDEIVSEVIDPVELLKDTTAKLRSAYAVVMEESIKLQQELIKSAINSYQQISANVIKEAVKEAVSGVVESLSKSSPASPRSSSSDLTEFLKTLLELRKEREKEKEERRKAVKLEVKE